MTGRPFGDHAAGYMAAGWIPLPLPRLRQFPPPARTLGPYLPPRPAEIDRWIRIRATSNIGLRLPTTVVAFDVDDRRLGGAALRRISDKLGPLPTSWQIRYSSTRRAYLFAIPEGVQLPSQLDVGIDVIQHNRGYLPAPPSLYVVDDVEHRPVFGIGAGDAFQPAIAPPATGHLVDLPARWLDTFRRSPQPHPSTYEYDRWAGATDDEIRAEADRVDAIVARFSADALPSIVRNGRRHFVDGTTTPGPVLYVVADGRPVRPYVPTEELGDHEAVGVFEFSTWARTPETEENPR